MKIWKRNITNIINALGKVTIELSNGKTFHISEEFGNLIINKTEDSIKIIPKYSNEIEIE
ncbi:MAG: hypothetical protein WBA74_10305 [Cyclobacteriaceae bacterium]